MVESSDVEYLTVQEVARKLRVCDLTIYRKIKRGELVAIPIGRGPHPHLRIPRESLAALVSGNRP
jgi:excisionase family DNA binding protein